MPNSTFENPVSAVSVGAVAFAAFAGGTASGAPTTGTHALGEFIVAQNGVLWICTTAGTPGLWTNPASSVSPATTVTSETTYGLASAVGTSLNYARQDHTHGSPPTGSYKDPVRVVDLNNITIASALVNGAVVDGVTLATGDRVLLIGQTAPAENGVYVVVASGAAARATDADTAAEILGMQTLVLEGTANAMRSYRLTTPSPITLGTTALTFLPFGPTMATVTDGTVYGAVKTAGIEGALSRGDHNHGTPSQPLWKDPVRVASTANVTLAGGLINGAVVDGVTLATGDRVLLKNQTTGSENGIYVTVASGTCLRSTDANTAAEVFGMQVYVIAGTTQGGSNWNNTNTTLPTLGTTALTFVADVTSVAGRVGVVALTAADIGTGTFPNGTYNFNGTNIQLQGGTGSIVLQGTLTAVGTVNGQTDVQFNGASLPRGTVGEWVASGAGTAVTNTTETAIYSGVGSFAFVSGRRYRITALLSGTITTAQASPARTLYNIRLGAGTAGTIIGQTSMIMNSAIVLTTLVKGIGVAGTDFAAGTSSLSLTATLSATNTLTSFGTAGPAISRILVEDIGV